MSDIDSLLAAFESGALVSPASGAPTLVDLAAALARLAGAESSCVSTQGDALAERIGRHEHLVFILADGLGMELLQQVNGNSFMHRRLVEELVTVFPSTTSVALTSLATAAWPARHGVTGWWTHLPQVGLASTIIHFAARADGKLLSTYGVLPSQAYPAPSLFGMMERDVALYLPEKFAESVYSRYFSGGQPVVGYRGLSEAVAGIVQRVVEADLPTYTYLYTSRIDDAAHAYGTTHPEVRNAVLEVDRHLERMAFQLEGRARIVLTADHGFLDAGEAARHQIRPSDRVLQWLRYPPSGDTRVLYMHTLPGKEDRVRRYFSERFGERVAILSIDEAMEIGLFGPEALTEEAHERLGDLMAVSLGADAIEYRPGPGAGRVVQEAAQHSGLTPAEMRIPLVVL